MNTSRRRPTPPAPVLLDASECGWDNPCQCPYHRQQRLEDVLGTTAASSPLTVPEMNCLRLAAHDYALARLRGDVAGMLRTSQMLLTLSALLLEQAVGAWQEDATLLAVAHAPLRLNA